MRPLIKSAGIRAVIVIVVSAPSETRVSRAQLNVEFAGRMWAGDTRLGCPVPVDGHRVICCESTTRRAIALPARDEGAVSVEVCVGAVLRAAVSESIFLAAEAAWCEASTLWHEGTHLLRNSKCEGELEWNAVCCPTAGGKWRVRLGQQLR